MTDTTALIEARKASADWHGIAVLKHLVLTGQLTLEAERDGGRLKAMSKRHRPAALELMQRYDQLQKDVRALAALIDVDLEMEAAK